MPLSIEDPDVRILANCAATLKSDYLVGDAAWQGSPFAWIKTRPSRQVGTIGEKLVAGWLATKGYDVARSPDSNADRLINGMRAEIKFSTLWISGCYKFQQLRDQDYKFVVCLGVSPFDAYCWAIPKRTILQQWKAGGEGLTSQHAGKRGTDTAWLSVTPGSVPAWMNEFGGRLAAAATLIARITGKKPLP